MPRDHPRPSGSSWLKANGHALLRSRGIYYLSKVPSIRRVPPSRPVTNSTCQVMTEEWALPGRGPGEARRAVLGWAGRMLSCASPLPSPSRQAAQSLISVTMLPASHCTAVPTRPPWTLRCTLPMRARQAGQCGWPPAPELLGLTVGRDCHRLRARPRRLTLGLQRLHWNVLLWDVPGCRIRAAALVRKQRAASFPIRPCPCGRPDSFGQVTLFSGRGTLSGESLPPANTEHGPFPPPFPHEE